LSARLERILASIGTPAHIDQETPREVILALEVRRLRAELAGQPAKAAKPAEPAASPEDIPGVAAHQAHGGLTLAEQAAAAAITLARRGGA
jgi:hypothetical protein